VRFTSCADTFLPYINLLLKFWFIPHTNVYLFVWILNNFSKSHYPLYYFSSARNLIHICSMFFYFQYIIMFYGCLCKNTLHKYFSVQRELSRICHLHTRPLSFYLKIWMTSILIRSPSKIINYSWLWQIVVLQWALIYKLLSIKVKCKTRHFQRLPIIIIGAIHL